ncbi:MAG TPA: tRNA dihydrouridine(20/20a) synthase DusA, partial [Burkholderiaceae bacterium]|nr:tRNA dihydrouridine(20/20a) synthase DusA [Burkholderiaceae bacterium]
HNPWLMATWDEQFYGANAPSEITRESIEEQMVQYMEREKAAHGTPWPAIARHMLGLRHGLRGARHWRQVWSNQNLRDLPPSEVMKLAHAVSFESDVLAPAASLA